ncbi:hypothetical protein [Winogradskyella flava]|uniref:STAS/SEC14 domain-containing protein n=1 Tax=Winogradskyella flava TaxID=1884876 RepID=A0A842IT08_9FLAO|nr:hypothetical protein [Winogradskyella flava]MBC2845289.1 hypothetical protein [Winogradskyella flava]
MKVSLTFDFCDMTIYDNYLVVVIKEGVNITPDHNSVLLEVTEMYFSDKPFVYITHRLNSYSVDPKIYFETVKIENLKGFAVVSKNYQAKINAQIEQMFFTKPFEIFTKLDEAIEWAEDVISKS